MCILIPLLANTPAPPTVDQRSAADVQSDRPFQALFQIEYSAAHNGWTADLAQQAGSLSYAVGDLARAVAYWEVALTLDPSNMIVARLLAQGYIALQRWSQAVIALNRIVEVDDDIWSHFQLGLLQTVFNPESASLHLHLGARDPQFEVLYNELSPLLTTTVPDATAVMRIGVVLAAHEHWDFAEYVFQYAASLRHPFPVATAYAGLARDRQGKSGSELIEQAVAQAPDNAQVRYLQGLHLRVRGDEQSSLMAFQHAASIDPLNPAFAAELGFAYQHLGSAVQAEYWYKAAVTLSSNDPRFQKLLEDFYLQTPPIVN